MYRENRRLDAPELDAFHRHVEVRSKSLRVGWHVGRNVASDYALVQRAIPFLRRMSRPQLSIVLEGHGRFDEEDRHVWVEAGSIVASDQRLGGTEAYAGATSSILILEWDPIWMGAPLEGGVQLVRLDARDRARLGAVAAGLESATPARATAKLVELVRSLGIALEPVDERELLDVASEHDQRLGTAISKELSRLDAHPSIEDVVDCVGWSSRHVNRRFATLAGTYGLPFESWRTLLHFTRIFAATRLLSAGATTERVARRTGFRSPTALCHAFAKAQLPSPGVLARSARCDVLDTWTAFG